MMVWWLWLLGALLLVNVGWLVDRLVDSWWGEHVVVSLMVVGVWCGLVAAACLVGGWL